MNSSWKSFTLAWKPLSIFSQKDDISSYFKRCFASAVVMGSGTKQFWYLKRAIESNFTRSPIPSLLTYLLVKQFATVSFWDCAGKVLSSNEPLSTQRCVIFHKDTRLLLRQIATISDEISLKQYIKSIGEIYKSSSYLFGDCAALLETCFSSKYL